DHLRLANPVKGDTKPGGVAVFGMTSCQNRRYRRCGPATCAKGDFSLLRVALESNRAIGGPQRRFDSLQHPGERANTLDDHLRSAGVDKPQANNAGWSTRRDGCRRVSINPRSKSAG